MAKFGVRSAVVVASSSLLMIAAFQNCDGMGARLPSSEAYTITPQEILQLPGSLSSSGDQNIRPLEVFPDQKSLLPTVTGTQADNAPQTLDLAERAKLYLQGATQSLLADQDYAPGGPAIFQSTVPGEMITYYEKVGDNYQVRERPVCWNVFPCIENDQIQNWGKVTLAMFLARRMSNYDADNRDGTLQAQLLSARNMIDRDANFRFAQRGPNTALQFLTPGTEQAITPTTVILESLSEMQQIDPNNLARRQAIDELVTRHQTNLMSGTFQGKNYFYYWNKVDANLTSEQGTVRTYQPFIQGKALYALSRWRNFSNDPTSNALSGKLRDYLLGYNNSELWATPNSALYPQESGQFVGQMHSYLVTVNAVLESIRPMKNSDPVSFYAYGAFAKDVYEFAKRRSRTGLVGNFGEIGTTGDMIRLGLLLTELGISDQWEDVDAWTRNALAEAQIDDELAAYIPNQQSPNLPLGWNNVGTKSKGLFVSDATHVFDFPLNQNFRYNVDGPSNAMRAMYEVWKKSVTVSGGFAAVNLLLNRSHRYFEVKSHIPFRGRVEVVTRPLIGPITKMGIRIPNWGFAGAGFQLYENGRLMTEGTETTGDWYRFPGNYMQFTESI